MTRASRRTALLLVLALSLALAPAVVAREADPFDPIGLGVPSAPVQPPAQPQGPPQLGAAEPDASNWDASNWDGSNWDGSNWDGSNWDASNWDASRWDGSNWDASNWDASNWDASNWDANAFSGYDALYKYQWGLRATNAPGAWAIMGPGDQSRIICVLDSGVDSTHPDLRAQMWHDERGYVGYDFVDDDPFPMDVGGHGTHVASIAAGRAGDAYGVAGMANARIMAVRVIGPDGLGTDEDLVAGIRYCADHGADILSMSLSTIEDVKLVASAVDYAVGKGALVVGSGGNTQCQTCQSPLLKLRGVLTITAVGPDGQVAPFTTWGPTVDLAAPGVAIPGAVPRGFALASGVSQAVPHVSGAAALVWQRNPSLTAGDVADVLRQSAQVTGQTAFGPLRVLDVDAAIRLAPSFDVSDADGAVGVSSGGVTADPGDADAPVAPGNVAPPSAPTAPVAPPQVATGGLV